MHCRSPHARSAGCGTYQPPCRYSAAPGNASGNRRISVRMRVLSRVAYGCCVRSRCIAFVKAGCGNYQPLCLYSASSGNGVGCPQHRRWCSRWSICMSPCILIGSRQGKLFRAPSAYINACVQVRRVWRFCCSGHLWLFPLRERMLAIMALRPYAGKL